MEDKNYYTVIYEATYPDCGVISYKPIKMIKGKYDIENELFIDEATGETFLCVNDAVPLFGKNEDHVINAIPSEIENYVEEGNQFFAFPVEEKQLEEYGASSMFPKEDPVELYEREVRGYFLYAIYDETVDDNVFYVSDKFQDHASYNVDVSLDILASVDEARKVETNQQLLVVVAGNLDDMMSLGETDEVQATNVSSAPTAENTVLTPILFDFDPDELEEKINSEVIGQEHVVEALVSLMYKNKRYHDQDGLKSNMLILGPSGCGKTEIPRSLSRNLDIPITIFDATSATASGYVGNSVNQAIRDLIAVCNGDITKAENGIIVIDEIDKLAQQGEESVHKSDVQNELFKMLEGDVITLPGDHSGEKPIRFDPKNVTFICVGSAQRLIEQMREEKAKRPIGFSMDSNSKVEESEEKEIILEPENLINFGLKAELLRRLPVIKVVKQLKTKDLVDILTNSKISNLRMYEKAFQDIDHVTLVTDEETRAYIAEKSLKEKAGASGLKRVVDDTLRTAVRKIRLLNGAPGELVISKETVDNPDNFQLYQTDGQNKVLVYPPKEKVKTLGARR